MEYFFVFLGAGLGGALRHGANLIAYRSLGAEFPWGTMAVNLIGSLTMGLLAGWFAQKFDPGQGWRLFIAAGVLGGFTTFSAFSLDTVLLFERGQLALVAFYVVGSVAGSVAALVLGLLLIRHLTVGVS